MRFLTNDTPPSGAPKHYLLRSVEMIDVMTYDNDLILTALL